MWIRRWVAGLVLASGVAIASMPGCYITPVVGPGTSDEEGQAETALATAQAFVVGVGVTDVAVMSFNDFSIGTVGGLPEFTFDSTKTVRLARRGSSGWGYAVGQPTPIGIAWQYLGKLRPAGWTVTVDPSIAVNPIQRSEVFMAQLATSDAAFLAASGGADELESVSAYTDGVCVARSVNGGFTFSTECFEIPPAGPDRFLDKTAVAVDDQGRVLVAVEDQFADHPDPNETLLGAIRVFRSLGTDEPLWRQFEEVQIPPDQAPGLGQFEPRLKSGPFGEVYLQSAHFNAPQTAPELRVLQFFADEVLGGNLSTVCAA